MPNNVAETPCPNPHTAPTRAARYHGNPQQRGINAAKWSGPAMACNDPANIPPVMVAVRAEMAVIDCNAKFVMIGVNAATDADDDLCWNRDDGFGNACRDDVVLA